jgi:hypothetical protein
MWLYVQYGGDTKNPENNLLFFTPRVNLVDLLSEEKVLDDYVHLPIANLPVCTGTYAHVPIEGGKRIRQGRNASTYDFCRWFPLLRTHDHDCP